jgi:hypothetical protein
MISAQPISGYMQLYQYLQVLSEEQIIKLRKIGVGMLQLSAFTKEEIEQLEHKLRHPEKDPASSIS